MTTLPASLLPGGAALSLWCGPFKAVKPLQGGEDPTQRRVMALPGGSDTPLRGRLLAALLLVRPLQDSDDPTPVKMLPSQAAPLQRDPFLVAGEAPSRLPAKTLPREPNPDGGRGPFPRAGEVPKPGGCSQAGPAPQQRDCGQSPYSTATSDHPTRRGRSLAERPLPGGVVASQQQRPYPTESDDPTQRGRSPWLDTFQTASEAPPFPTTGEANPGATGSPAGKLFPDTRHGPFPTARHLAGGDDPPPRRA
ncbi:proline-rich protein HaeIII subfamily 1-like [Meles meles]|uniref:proline-rich protein HaeIII subfamily 1-like n=1 Tax=Meles meles TaxID=9662 RepID=UPI001E69A241|nr:proline-rich protein HaeIII subfamily 1-like [Meles meles]